MPIKQETWVRGKTLKKKYKIQDQTSFICLYVYADVLVGNLFRLKGNNEEILYQITHTTVTSRKIALILRLPYTMIRCHTSFPL